MPQATNNSVTLSIGQIGAALFATAFSTSLLCYSLTTATTTSSISKKKKTSIRQNVLSNLRKEIKDEMEAAVQKKKIEESRVSTAATTTVVEEKKEETENDDTPATVTSTGRKSWSDGKFTSRDSKLHKTEYPMLKHNHGKARVRVMKVHRSSEEEGKHYVYEYEVATKLFSAEYGKVFTALDNAGLVATDTQKNTVYVIAKRTKADSPEQFGLDLAKHFLQEYPILEACEIHVRMTKWNRIVDMKGEEHNHGFIKQSPELATANVFMVQKEGGLGPDYEKAKVTSFIEDMTVLKTTLSGFEDFHRDKYTLLPDTDERCLATKMNCEWTYHPDMLAEYAQAEKEIDFAQIHEKVRALLCKGVFGYAKKGVYSVSLQATIYDCACLVLQDVSQVWTIKIDTPNLHYLPMNQLERLGEKFENDVFIPTSEPSGTITCTVGRDENTVV